MRAVVQRVRSASVTADQIFKGEIQTGLLIFVGIEDADNMEDIGWLSNKIINLRIFNDDKEVPNLSVKEIAGDVLLVSQFTLHASTKKGNRPSYLLASKGEVALPLYQELVKQLERDLGKAVITGVFGSDMQVTLVNDGPITIIIDTKKKE